MYAIEFTPAAARQLRRLYSQDKAAAERVVQAIVELEVNPRPSGCKKLKGTKSSYRIRNGTHRVLYDVVDHKLLVTVVGVGHRREVY